MSLHEIFCDQPETKTLPWGNAVNESAVSVNNQQYLTMHFHDDPSMSSCSSVYKRMFCSWSSWSQYIRPCWSRPIGCKRIFSGSSSLIAILNFTLSSNWDSQRYFRWKNRQMVRGEDRKSKNACIFKKEPSEMFRSVHREGILLWGCLICTPLTFLDIPYAPGPMTMYC